MEKILLLNPPGNKLFQRDMYCSNVSKANYYWPSIDLLILSGILSQKYKIDVIDAIIKRMKPQECLEKIKSQNYKAVIFLTGMASWKQDFEFLSKVKNKNNKPLLIGNGDILLYRAEYFLNRYSFLDAVLFDYTSPDALNYLQNNYKNITSMAFRINGNIELRKRKISSQEFSYPTPLHEKFPLKKYRFAPGKRFPFTTVQTNFGCPYKCSFCIASTLGFKHRALGNVMEELRYIVSLGIKEVFFTDFTFEARRKNTLELCQKMVNERLNLSWVCSSRANTLDRELLAWMKLAGCHTILIGVESGHEELLKIFSKGITKDQLKKTFSLCREMGIRTLGHFIIGLPGETVETVKKTIEFSKELNCDLASFNIAMPALGTPLREMALKSGWLQEDVLEFDASDSFPVLETPQFSKEQAWKWRNQAVKEFYFRPAYLWKMATSSYSAYQWKMLISNGLAVLKNVVRRADFN